MIRSFVMFAGFLLATPVLAEGFQTVRDKGKFLSLVSGKDLRIPLWGITLKVMPDGKITGSALGRPVTGAWQWQEGYFCRDLTWGERELGPNCQEVKVQGRTVRFTSDRGEGMFADLTLR
ncbi:dihydrodipicolinate reductase [Lutimaribacter saemankumensis]|uniref:Dihydrodipicolinate reductase n=1 Tax=Lutimaribacter saemankumensis TaxID=490829 RepID=A0A1G8N7U6_9RHOB|nr:dihydrodipicolinate reductase [Lutimaribacter saemankumensis]SDI76146.1 hypothetical protein SAMN05421850_10597 [Lutimaribacter saemankumensis]